MKCAPGAVGPQAPGVSGDVWGQARGARTEGCLREETQGWLVDWLGSAVGGRGELGGESRAPCSWACGERSQPLGRGALKGKQEVGIGGAGLGVHSVGVVFKATRLARLLEGGCRQEGGPSPPPQGVWG